MNTLVLGVGNFLLKDEGVGVHAIRALEALREEFEDRALAARPPFLKNVELLDGGTGGLHLLHWLRGRERVIMIDATLDEHPPGTVRVIRPHRAADFPPLMSAHEIGIGDMLAALTLSGEELPDIRLILISVADIRELGTDLSPEVSAAIPEIIQTVRDELEDVRAQA